MSNIDSYFLGIDYDVVCPPVLSEIKEYLNCEQVCIYKLDQQGELENVIHTADVEKIDNNVQAQSLYQIDPNIVNKIINSSSEDDDTVPLKKSELMIPIDLKTPEVIKVNNNISLWGILVIYDYNYLRQWEEKEIEFIHNRLDKLTLAIEKSIIYQQFKNLEKKLQYYQFFDEQTGLVNYPSFMDCLDYEWRNLARQKKPLSLILIQLFAVEKCHDLITPEVAKVVQKEIKRPADIAAHYGQNKIMIMLPLTDNTGALWLGQQISQQIEAYLQEQTNCQCRSSIITCIPKLEESYHLLMSNISESVPEENALEKISNHNLV